MSIMCLGEHRLRKSVHKRGSRDKKKYLLQIIEESTRRKLIRRILNGNMHMTNTLNMYYVIVEFDLSAYDCIICTFFSLRQTTKESINGFLVKSLPGYRDSKIGLRQILSSDIPKSYDMLSTVT